MKRVDVLDEMKAARDRAIRRRDALAVEYASAARDAAEWVRRVATAEQRRKLVAKRGY